MARAILDIAKRLSSAARRTPSAFGRMLSAGGSQAALRCSARTSALRYFASQMSAA